MDIYVCGAREYCCTIIDGKRILVKSRETDNRNTWLAIINALLEVGKGEELNIFMDSVLVFKQITYQYNIKNKYLKKLYLIFNKLRNEKEPIITFNLIDKKKNKARKEINDAVQAMFQ